MSFVLEAWITLQKTRNKRRQKMCDAHRFLPDYRQHSWGLKKKTKEKKIMYFFQPSHKLSFSSQHARRKHTEINRKYPPISPFPPLSTTVSIPSSFNHHTQSYLSCFSYSNPFIIITHISFLFFLALFSRILFDATLISASLVFLLILFHTTPPYNNDTLRQNSNPISSICINLVANHGFTMLN